MDVTLCCEIENTRFLYKIYEIYSNFRLFIYILEFFNPSTLYFYSTSIE